MGCAGSKLDDLPALVLCRDRSSCLESAIRYRYALSQSHLSYTQSLHALGVSLHRFFDVDAYDNVPLSPVLPLPAQSKLAPEPGPDLARMPPPSSSPPPQISAASPAALHHSHSDSGSHLHFHPTDSDTDSGGDSSPLHDDVHDFVHDEVMPPSPPVRYNTSYMQNRPTIPTVETIQVSEPSSSYAYPYFYPNFNYSEYGGFFGSPPPMQQQQQQQQQQMMQPPPYGYYGSSSAPPPPEAPSSSRPPPPPPPPPPSSSAWDFLNVFNSMESSYPTAYTPSRNSKDVREEEGIPDLEDVENQDEVVKEVHGQQKFVGGGDDGRIAKDGGIAENTAYFKSRGVEYEVHMVDKNVVADEDRVAEGRKSNAAPAKGHGRPRGISEVVEEIRALFDRASEAGSEVSKLLEVGKLPYRGKRAVYKVSSKMLDAITPLPMVASHSSTSKGAGELPSSEDVGSLSLDYDKDIMTKSGSLSSTLERLYIWEKKLYEEVKAEEKMRIINDRKNKRLRHLDERGAEAYKVDATRTLVLKLATKIRIAIKVVNSISNKINKLRDEELWPQINELIQGLLQMWKVMVECHRSQLQIISEAKNLDAIASYGKFSDVHMKATVQLELDLLNLMLSFYAWISAQKGYVKALNGWLVKCIFYEPEETVDGVVPFSPGRLGAPPAFVICNQWSQAMDRISENEVFVALRAFSISVFRLWQRHNLAQRQSMMVNKEMDSHVKYLEREEQKLQKALDAVNKKLVMISEESGLPLPGQIDPSFAAENDSLQVGLKQVFEAMEKFCSEFMKAYEELHARSEEESRAPEGAKP